MFFFRYKKSRVVVVVHTVNNTIIFLQQLERNVAATSSAGPLAPVPPPTPSCPRSQAGFKRRRMWARIGPPTLQRDSSSSKTFISAKLLLVISMCYCYLYVICNLHFFLTRYRSVFNVNFLNCCLQAPCLLYVLSIFILKSGLVPFFVFPSDENVYRNLNFFCLCGHECRSF